MLTERNRAFFTDVKQIEDYNFLESQKFPIVENINSKKITT